MKKNKIFKSVLLAGCLAACATAGVTFTACNLFKKDGGVSFVEEVEKKGPQFLEGSLADIEVGATVIFSEYIDYVYDADYTITMTDPNGNVQDITDEIYFIAENPGDYVITYTIKSGKSKGSNTFTLHVTYPELTWDFTLQNMPYNFGDTLVFRDYFNNMNISASLENYQIFMDCVEVDGKTVNLLDKESYTFQSMSDHTFKFHIESADGQTCEGREVISMKYIDEEYLQYLTEDLGISVYGDLYVEDGNYTMVAGSYCNGNNVWLKRENGPHNLPYIAYNGDYGIDSYVKVDFTGDNMPIFSFFRDDNYSKSIFDGTKGVVYTGGFTNNSGEPIHEAMCSRGTLYGPYMMHEYDRGADDTTTIGSTDGDAEAPHLGSLRSLKDGTHYRMIAGFSGIRSGRANLLGTETPVDTLFLTFDCVIIDLDTQEVFSNFTISSYGIQALGFDKIPLDTENNSFFNGNIVLYGKHGAQTKLDKIYPVITGKTFDQICEEELTFSSFKDDAQTFFLNSNVTLNVSDYVDTTKEGYIFYYVDQDGKVYEVEGETFTLEKAGSYTLYYSDGENLCTTLNLYLGEFSAPLVEWIETNNISFYGLGELTEDYEVTLNAGTLKTGGTCTGPNPGNLVDQAYMALNGEYGLDDYVAFDFTGKNMPEVAFFAQNYNNSMYYQDGGKQGIVFTNGITKLDGSINEGGLNDGKAVNIDSLYMVENINDSWFKQNSVNDSKLARANLVDGKHYRVILGFTGGSEHGPGGITLNWYLYDLDTKEVLEEAALWTYNFFNGGTHGKINNMTFDDLVGAIVLYGKFGTELKLDKVWGVYEDTTMADVVKNFNKNEKFTVTFKDLDGNTLKTLENVPFGTTVSYEGTLPTPPASDNSNFVYGFEWDKAFMPIEGNTVYTLKLIQLSKDGKFHNVTFNGDAAVFAAGSIGGGANYMQGQQVDNDAADGVDSFVNQSYLSYDGNYGMNDYIAFDFTGKNMPEIAFFAKNYNDTMYYEEGKQGVVVYTGITTYDGQDAPINLDKPNGTFINYGFPYMIQNAANGAFTRGAFADSQLGRANLVDGTHYRVIMGFTEYAEAGGIELKWCLYNLDTNTVVEESSMATWNFFTGSEAAVNNMTVEDLVGSIVLYGKFGTELTIDKLYGVYENTTIANICAALEMN